MSAPNTMSKSLSGLRASHYEACAAEGMTEEEIDRDWEQVEKDLAAFSVEDLAVIA